ncbi:anti sigma factor C-terminal domain-containing protein [Alkaliphilus sp. B6464]|uniref:anti sigma factor C-terminal domain-containing protein n=1 Tax=Alkaliphilus sp. B6464 TaxID=2731219 RepID=UPI001BA71522|nr:anti sigma factor C-terminal domain-containing protein [Alkaliphilus sp. B6464]QUH20376.1 anti sigma factor C-terminal domain-containing protein [Alkaliphilus sp. B6464]
MKYKELLNLYKEGLVNEEEKHHIEQEIEKYEALEEYLSGIIEEEFDEVVRLPRNEKYAEETIKLKKSVNKRLRKVIYTSVAVVIALVVSIFLIISPLVDSLYYNPNKITVSKARSDINFDVHAILELNMPGLSPSTVLVDKQGFGKYNVEYSYRNLFTDEIYDVSHKIQRGEIVSSYKDPILSTGMFINIRYPYSNENYIKEKKQNVINHLKQLNPISYVSSSILFEKDLTMEELFNLESKYPNIEFIWAGIRTASPDEEVRSLLGIQLMKSNSVLLADKHIGNKYPAFFIWDWLVNPVGLENSNSRIEAQAYKHHYMSLLQYVVDREVAVNVLEHRTGKDKYYQSALDYAKENGVKTYGVLVFAEAKDLLNMLDNEEIKGLEFNQALVSKKNIY